MKVVYGLNAAYEADPTMEAIEEGLGSGREVLVQGASLVETLPFLRHLPSFLPFQKRLACARDASARMYAVPYELYKAAAVSASTF